MGQKNYTIEFCVQVETTARNEDEALQEVERIFGRSPPHRSREAGVPYIDVVDTQEAPELDGETVLVKFYPQAWADDYAVSADPIGRTEWEMPLSEAVTDDGTLPKDDSAESDALKNTEYAPAWVREWTGPFYITTSRVWEE